MTTSLTNFNSNHHVCPECSTRKPITDFAVITRGIPLLCKQCKKERQYAHARERLEKIATKSGIADLATISRQKIDSPHISQLCESLIAQFGGLQAFTNFYFSQIQLAAASNPGSRTVLEACKTVIGLVNQSTEHRQSAPDVVDMTDDELERERTRLLLELMTRDTSGEAIEILTQLKQGTYDDEPGRGIPEEAPAIEAGGSGEGTPGEGPPDPVRADSEPR